MMYLHNFRMLYDFPLHYMVFCSTVVAYTHAGAISSFRSDIRHALPHPVPKQPSRTNQTPSPDTELERREKWKGAMSP